MEKCKLGDDGPAGYRYIIEGGFAPITGFRAGTKDKVFKHATGLADEMNARRGMKGTKHIVIGKIQSLTRSRRASGGAGLLPTVVSAID